MSSTAKRDAGSSRRRSQSGCRTNRFERRWLGARQGESKPGAFAERARHREVTAHAPREIAADRQPEPGTFVLRRVVTIHLHERLEDRVELVGGNPGAVVARR